MRSGPEASPLELIREVAFAIAREAEEHLEEVKLIYKHSMRDPNYLFAPTPARKCIWEILVQLVTAAQRCNQIRRDLAARELALHILFLYQGVVLAIITGIGTPDVLLRSAWQFILEGVKGGDRSA